MGVIVGYEQDDQRTFDYVSVSVLKTGETATFPELANLKKNIFWKLNVKSTSIIYQQQRKVFSIGFLRAYP